MGAYRPLFSISVKHHFFSKGFCPGLDFVPTAASAEIMDKTGMLIRSAPGGIQVFHDEERIDALRLYADDPDEPLRFCFKVYSTDPLFGNYTALPASAAASILYFDTRMAQGGAASPVSMHDGEYVSEGDLEEEGSPVLKDVIGKRESLVRPSFVVNIRGPKNKDGFPPEIASTDCQIKFDCRRTFWKYYLMGRPGKGDMFIADMDKEVEFESAGVEVLPGGRAASTFISKVPIPLLERSDRRFQLKEKGPGGERVLVKRLPVASAQRIHKEGKDKIAAVISEIFIN